VSQIHGDAVFRQHNAAHCNTLQHTTTQSTTLQHTATHTATHLISHDVSEEHHVSQIHGDAVFQQHNAAHCNTLQHTATHCTTPQHTAPHTATYPAGHDISQEHHASLIHGDAVLQQHNAAHCNTLQHTATHHKTLYHTATHAATHLVSHDVSEEHHVSLINSNTVIRQDTADFIHNRRSRGLNPQDLRTDLV